ncbi:hypothetical protein BKA69DRAFT_528911 [Paraphysoderma sedebokerense]|nr:hypothetical protein BKA69DRAFT_528911 [Paraphysoderma sedebokerense]
MTSLHSSNSHSHHTIPLHHQRKVILFVTALAILYGLYLDNQAVRTLYHYHSFRTSHGIFKKPHSINDNNVEAEQTTEWIQDDNHSASNLWIGNVSLLDAINDQISDKRNKDKTVERSNEIVEETAESKSGGRNPKRWKKLEDETDGVFVFVQISDLHVSRYNTHGGHTHFLHFLKSVLPNISPQFVVVTGDLTDAKDRKKITSQQYKDEWVAYKKALEDSGVVYRKGGKFWFDMRGNHDCFNLPSWSSNENYYAEFSAAKKEGYSFTYTREFGNYTFVSLDACPPQGPSRPFNFFAVLTANDLDFLQSAIINATSQQHNHVVVMSHYPLSTTVIGTTSNGVGFDELSKGMSLYLCGHLHTLVGGIGKKLQAYHPHRHFLELELGDMKVHALYRIIVVDHDLISFKDVVMPLETIPHEMETILEKIEFKSLTEQQMAPIVIVTNPKDSSYLIPHHEPTHLIRLSTHIRFLIYSAHAPSSLNISITINGAPHRSPVQYVGTGDNNFKSKEYVPLFVSKWDPELYKNCNGDNYDEGHRETQKGCWIAVNVTDPDGRKGSDSVKFNVVGRRTPMRGGLGEWIILARFPDLIRGTFLFTYLTTMVLFILSPKLYTLSLLKRNQYTQFKQSFSSYLINLDFQSLSLSSLISNGSSLSSSPSDSSPTSPVDGDIVENFEKLRDDSKNAEKIIHKFPSSTARRKLLLIYIDFKFFLAASWFRLCNLTLIGSVWWPIWGYMCWILSGPLFSGYLIANYPTLQHFYIYGIYFPSTASDPSSMVAGPSTSTWLPLLDTWLYTTLELLHSILPFTIYLSFCTSHPMLIYHRRNIRYIWPIHRRWYTRMIVAAIVMYQLWNAYMMGIFYGFYATFLSIRTAWSIWAAITIYRWRWRGSVRVRGFRRVVSVEHEEDEFENDDGDDRGQATDELMQHKVAESIDFKDGDSKNKREGRRRR